MFHAQGFNSIERSPIAELLDMIAARAPLFMKTGDLVEDKEPYEFHRGLPYGVRQKLRRSYQAGKPTDRIAADLGVHRQTVWRHTRDLRRK